MIKQDLYKLVIAIGLILPLCFNCSNQKSAGIQKESISSTDQTINYWVVTMNNPIGTLFISVPLALPVDDHESIAIAANAWGRRKFQTDEKNVYKFNNQDEAEKFRRERKGVDLKLTPGGLKKYLCLGQTSPPATDYWVFIFRSRYEEGQIFISEVCDLPEYDEEFIKEVALLGAQIKTRKIFDNEDGEFHKFASQEDAESFRRGKGFINLNLNARTLKKLFCAEQVLRSETKHIGKINDEPDLLK